MPLQNIDCILFEPVGCLAEFGSEEFDAIARQVFSHNTSLSPSGSQAYWDVLTLLENTGSQLSQRERAIVEDYEIQAVNRARAYEDVAPALSEMKGSGTRLMLGSSLSATAVKCFLDRFSLVGWFDDVWSRDTAGGVKHVPLMKAISSRSLTPDRVMFITDTAEGLHTAREVGVNAILMMNDPDEAMRLTSLKPAGGIVSLAELPDFIRFVAAGNTMLAPNRVVGTGSD
jgi:phosphoglycolate phosphatase-like HAD superfamily hydrolase